MIRLTQNYCKWILIAVVICIMLLAGVWRAPGEKELDYRKALAITQAMSGQDIALYQAYLALKAYGVQPSDCYICSASGFVPDPEANVVRKEPFDHYKMTAFLISYREFNDGDTLPLSIAIGSKETLMTEAKMSRLASCLYHVEFDLPCEKIANASEYKIFVKCGDGENVNYDLFKDQGGYVIYLFMSGKTLPHLTPGSSSGKAL